MEKKEHYNLLLIETHTKIYYANSGGKVGYVNKGELSRRNNRMNESLIHWVKPKEIVRQGKRTLSICINGEHRTVKKLIAKAFIRGYDNKKHYVSQLDNNYKNCSVENLKLLDKLPLQQVNAQAKHSKELKVKRHDWQDFKVFPSIRPASVYLHVYQKTLTACLKGRFKNSCLSVNNERVLA